ncbi:MAG: hypothetical protein M9921_05625 [Fimbriimonadaceae bacterium]|nr:hypothetical protein [Fimbriimonadaceae bacterium]
MRLFVSAGEASGDAYGAALLNALGPLPNVAVEAVGGPKLRAAGARLVADSTRWGAIGIAQALRVVPRMLGSYYRAKRAVGRGEPGVLVPIDFGYMNLRLARHAKNHGWRVLYFIPPGSWRRDRQGGDLPALTDAIVTPFPWSAEHLCAMGANAHFFGHPLKQMVARGGVAEGVRETIAVLPGSRDDEVARNLPVIAEALAARPERAEFAVASSIGAARLESAWRRLAPGRTGDAFTEGDTYGVLKRARAGIVCSGTATLEAALCGCPMVVVYRVGPLAVLEAKLVRLKFDFISQPNILLGRRVVPELIQDAATAANVRAMLEPLLGKTPERAAQLEAFKELDALLGPADAIDRTAELLRAMGG